MKLFSTKSGRKCLIALLVTLGSVSAYATGVSSNNIVMTFSDPVLAGDIANYPGAGQTTYFDDTSTAVYTISNGTGSSSLSWGSYPGTPTFQTYSEITFTGSAIPGVVTSPFQLGTIVYTNGTSEDGTGIFGATLNFYDGTIDPSTYLGSDQLIITSTANVFGVPGGLTDGDDDYINICGNDSNICGTSIEAVESSEGGTGVTVDLMGTLDFNVTSVELAPGQNSLTNGFLGSDPPIGVTPEPATWTTLGSALGLGLILFRRRILASR